MGTPEIDNSATSSQQNAELTEGQQNQPPVDWEKRFKDTQAAYTKSRQEIAELRAKLTVKDETKMQLSPEERDALEDLKFNDPEAWRIKMNELEQQADAKLNQRIQEETQKLSELEQRQITLEAFMHSHPGFHIDDDVIKYDVPARITKKLDAGEITFDVYLEEVYQYLNTPKVIGSANQDIDQPNLNRVGGGTTAAPSATAADIVVSYRNEVY